MRATLVRQQTTKGWTEQEDPQTHQKKLVESSSTDTQVEPTGDAAPAEVQQEIYVYGGARS